MNSPCQNSLKMLRKAGYICAITEHWNKFARIRQDAFGFIDIIGIKSGEPILAIQTTTRTNISARQNKICELEAAKVWSMAGGFIDIHAWSKKDGRYQCLIRHLEFDPLTEWQMVEFDAAEYFEKQKTLHLEGAK